MPLATLTWLPKVYGVVIRTKRSRSYNAERHDVAERSNWDVLNEKWRNASATQVEMFANELRKFRQDDWTTCDWHGVWVTDIRSPGSYGRIAYRDPLFRDQFWIRWASNPPDIKRESANLVGVENLKLLPVAPEPWFT